MEVRDNGPSFLTSLELSLKAWVRRERKNSSDCFGGYPAMLIKSPSLRYRGALRSILRVGRSSMMDVFLMVRGSSAGAERGLLGAFVILTTCRFG